MVELIVFLKVICKMAASLILELSLLGFILAAITIRKNDVRWLRKIINKYMVGVEKYE